MKEICLNHGKVALVDDEDYDFLMKWKWHSSKEKKTYYAKRGDKHPTSFKQFNIKMHRTILGITDPNIVVDHIDRNGLNNQRSNLRTCTVQQNNCNRTVKANGSSQYLGVFWNKILNKWRVKITHHKKSIHVGLFHDEKEAAEAYNRAALKFHGEFASLNQIR